HLDCAAAGHGRQATPAWRACPRAVQMCPGFRPRAQIAARVGREAQGDPRGGFHSAGGARRRGARPARSAGHCAGVLAVRAPHWAPPGPAPPNARSHPAWRERPRASRSPRPAPTRPRGPDPRRAPRPGAPDARPCGTRSVATPQAVVSAWMASPGHLANLLEGQYRDTGIAIEPQVPAALADGASGATYAQEFGVVTY